MSDQTDNVVDIKAANKVTRIERKDKLYQMIENKSDAPWYRLWQYNAFTKQVEYTRVPPWASESWHEDDCYLFAANLLDEGISLPKPTILDAVEMSAHRHRYHPVRDYLNSLEWDGIQRVNAIFPSTLGTVDNAYTRALGRKTIIAAVLRIVEPGCMHRVVPILEGNQNTGKSTWVRMLASDKYYASVKLNSRTMQQPQFLCGKWILEFAELNGLTEVRTENIKAFVTAVNDHYRSPYERRCYTHPRESIFIGTYNPGNRGYLSDPTGSTRFWPVLTGRIEIPALVKYRDQYFAEALHYVRNGETSEITDAEVLRHAAIEQGKRNNPSPHFSWLADFTEYKNASTIEDIIRSLGVEKGKLTSRLMSDIQDDMLRLGFAYNARTGEFTRSAPEEIHKETLEDIR